MDEFIRQILPILGPAGPVAILGWWVINNQKQVIAAKDKVIETKDARIEKLTDQVHTLGVSMTVAMIELKATLKG